MFARLNPRTHYQQSRANALLNRLLFSVVRFVPDLRWRYSYCTADTSLHQRYLSAFHLSCFWLLIVSASLLSSATTANTTYTQFMVTTHLVSVRKIRYSHEFMIPTLSMRDQNATLLRSFQWQLPTTPFPPTARRPSLRRTGAPDSGGT
jgi:hypothetical protein